jgi:hypothetical protein
VKRRRAALAARRAALVEESGRLRAELATDAGALGIRFRLADRVVAVARSDNGRLVLMGLAALMFFGRPRRVLGAALKLLAFVPVVMPLLPHLKRWFGERKPASA